eukprot:1964917-Ditylum_brightwellii.AAC.1
MPPTTPTANHDQGKTSPNLAPRRMFVCDASIHSPPYVRLMGMIVTTPKSVDESTLGQLVQWKEKRIRGNSAALVGTFFSFVIDDGEGTIE